MSNTKLSHSAVERYLKCPTSYKYHYIDKLRPITTSANLLFGSALDEGINALLLKKNNAIETFKAKWLYGFINNQRYYLPDCELLLYGKNDLDTDILLEDDWNEIKMYHHSLFNHSEIDDTFKVIKEKSKSTYTEKELKYYNFLNWTSLKRKGLLIIKAYEKQVLPLIKEVKAIQKEIAFENEEGDKITGFIDLIAVMQDGNTYVLDNKSARTRYEDDAVKKSTQLALYAKHEELSKAGFIVYVKTIIKKKKRTCNKCSYVSDNGRIKTCDNTVKSKRCNGFFDDKVTPLVDIQILLDDINPNLVNLMLDNYKDVNTLIKEKKFFKRFDMCHDWYGAKCPYFNKCFNNSDEGLIK